ncbi:MAG: hypothetical protein H6Q00_1546 [Holophagaceae bacterium]|nr:hypothetical protein [Holophagaceae bacterium]
MSFPKSAGFFLILALGCAGKKAVVLVPQPSPNHREALEAKPKELDLQHLQGTLTAETIQQIAAFKCEMTDTQASLTQSISRYLESRDEEPYRASQSRVDQLTILTVHAKGMTRARAKALVEGVPRVKVHQYGWDKVILANDREGWIFDMAPGPGSEPAR